MDELPATMPRPALPRPAVVDLSIVLVNWNSGALIADCLRSLAASGTRINYEIIISDNASTDGSPARLVQLAQADRRVRCVFGATNAGFGVGNNRALSLCRGRHVLFLNADTLVLEPLDALVAAADQLGEQCGALGGRVLNADRTLQLTCRLDYTVATLIAGFTDVYLGRRPAALRAQELEDWDHAAPRDVAMLSGCYLLVPRRVLERVGGFDPQIFLFFEDTDLCYRIRAAGGRVRYVPVATIVHLEGGASRQSGLSARVLGASFASACYFARKHLGPGAEQAVLRSVRRRWRLMRLALAPAAAVMPLPGPRASLQRRARLLRDVLREIPQRRIG